jgi:hypothetical protein
MILFINCLNICIAIGDPVIKRRVGIINKTNIKHKETMTFDVGNPAPGLGQAQKCGSVILLNGIPTLLLITGSPMAIHIFKQLINKIRI